MAGKAAANRRENGITSIISTGRETESRSTFTGSTFLGYESSTQTRPFG